MAPTLMGPRPEPGMTRRGAAAAASPRGERHCAPPPQLRGSSRVVWWPWRPQSWAQAQAGRGPAGSGIEALPLAARLQPNSVRATAPTRVGPRPRAGGPSRVWSGGKRPQQRRPLLGAGRVGWWRRIPSPVGPLP